LPVGQTFLNLLQPEDSISATSRQSELSSHVASQGVNEWQDHHAQFPHIIEIENLIFLVR
jgi:hypothetical protein